MSKIKAEVIQDTYVLVPNQAHKNFTTGTEVIKKGTVVEGIERKIEGLRRGEPFIYKLFLTDDDQLIYLKSIKPMNTTEVTMGADSAQSPTKLNLVPAENAKTAKRKDEVYGLIIGGIIGFAYAKYKKHDLKKMAMYIAGGAALGYGAGLLIHDKKVATITPSK